ncbi:MAG: Copper amine oxidase N-terminal domain [Chthonomonadales bacterium]|nr:Copper amine oxidase N-terminal domain [Chthonomonadales bacterium]
MFTRSTKNGFALAGVAALVAFSGAGALAQSKSVSLTRGTVIAVHLQDSLSSNESLKGDRFVATVDDSSSKGNWRSDALPAGSTIKGYVRSVSAREGKRPGTLDLAFDRVVLPDGHGYSIQGSLISLDNKSITKDKNGRLIANKAHSNNRLTYVGIGAGAGALIGLVTSRKHVVEDSLLGAGAGLLFGALEKGKSPSDVKLKVGTQMGVRLDSRLAYSRK